MNGLEINPADAARVSRNWRIVNEVTDETYFRREIHPGMGSLASGAATAFASRAAVVDFPKAGNPAWRVNLRRAERWRRAGILARIWYTVDAAGGGNFSGRIQVINYDTGDNLAALALELDASVVLPAPVAAADVAYVDYINTATIIPGNKGRLTVLFLRFSGEAADTSANVLRVISIELKVLPQG